MDVFIQVLLFSLASLASSNLQGFIYLFAIIIIVVVVVVVFLLLSSSFPIKP